MKTMDQATYDRRLQAQIDDAVNTFRLINGPRPKPFTDQPLTTTTEASAIVAIARALEDAQYTAPKEPA